MQSMRSFIDEKTILTPDHGCVSMARYPNSNHGFLVIESTNDNITRNVWKADLIIKHGSETNFIDRNVNSDNRMFNLFNPKFNRRCIDSTRNSLESVPLPLQEAEVQLVEVDDLRYIYDADRGNILFLTYPVTPDEIEQLKTNIQNDMNRKIYYNYLGDGKLHMSNYSSNDYHSCVSYCKSKLREIGLNMPFHWHDAIVVHPQIELPSEGPNVGRCSLL